MSHPVRSTGPHLVLAALTAAAIAGALPLSAAAQDAAASYPASAKAADVGPWLAAHTSVRPVDIVAIDPQAVVSLDAVTAQAGTSAPALAVVREEIIDPGYAERRLARSARIEVELNCAGGAYRVRRLTRFPLPDLKGAGTEVAAPVEWAYPPEGAPMSRILHIGCARAAATPAGPAPRPAAAPAPVTASVIATAPAASPAPVAQAPVRQAPVTQATPPPPVSPALVAATAAPVAMPFRIQLGSYSTAENAHRASDELRRDFPRPVADHQVVVSQTSSGGRDYFLVLVQGFAARADAVAFCKAINAAPEQCLIRR